MTQNMGDVLQQALVGQTQSPQAGMGQDPTTTQTMAPTMEENFGQTVEDFQPEEIAEQLQAVEAQMEVTEDPNMLQQLAEVRDQLRLALEGLSAALPGQVESSPDPTWGQIPQQPMLPGMGPV